AGSWAVGCAWSTRPPRVDDVAVGRELIVGGDLTGPPLELPIGENLLLFTPSSVTGTAPLDPLRRLQNAMREAESRLAAQLLGSSRAQLVITDGPLSYFAEGPVIGLVKRQSRSYLDADRSQVLAQLRVGERTPIFKLGQQRLERYSWYLRIASPRAIDGPMAGVVRLEVGATGGLE